MDGVVKSNRASPIGASKIRITTIGDATEEFRAVEDAIRCVRPAESRTVLQMSSLPRMMARGDLDADLVVVFQNRPDEFLRSEVDDLLASMPLSRVVCVYSSWCESDGRTRSAWPFAVRVPVHRAAERIRKEVEVLRGVSTCLPVTASRDEVFQLDFSQHVSSTDFRQEYSAAIITPDRVYGQTVSDIVNPRLNSVAWYASISRFKTHVLGGPTRDVIFLDADPCSTTTLDNFSTLRSEFPAARLVALCNYPRTQDRQALSSVGVNAVVSKLCSLAELTECIEVA